MRFSLLGELNVVKLFVEELNADVSIKNKDGTSALSIAIHR